METMRAFVIEVRQGPGLWEGRADYTMGKWIGTPWGTGRPFQLVREDLELLNPFYLVVQVESGEGETDA